MAITVALATTSVPSIAHAEADAGTGEAGTDPLAEHRFAPGFFAALHRLLAAAAALAGRTG
ncbi:hypothetical protein AOA12_02000 [Microbacterium sp. No. 7]|nr:hypothetical protein AOA12_02000 [Microbacterium sp. No. 7]